MRVVLVILILGLVSIGQAWAVDLEKRVAFEIPAQELSAALLLFAKQANVQVMSSTEVIGSRRSAGVHGELAIGAALAKLLGECGQGEGDERRGLVLRHAVGCLRHRH